MRRVHGATVEQVEADGEVAYRAACIVTGVVCDAWGFVDYMSWDDHAEAIERALKYIGDESLHDPGSRHGCLGADHVMAHDLPTRRHSKGGGRP